MTLSYDSSTPQGQVRLLIQDNDLTNALFQDEEVQTFLDLNDQNVFYAAALALESVATNESLVTKRIMLLDLRTDGPAVAADLRAHAAQLRALDNSEGFDWAEMATGIFVDRERLNDVFLRRAG